jgi:hypothetical protein
MSDLISRSALIEKIKTVADYDWNDTRRKAYKEFLDMLTNAREMSYEHNEKSRLLDAKEIIRIAESEFDENDMFKIRWLIAHTPTAYDIEKVVAELEKEILGKPMHQEFCNGIYRAIDIARKGGVE